MIELIIYSVASFGASYVVGHSVISMPLRYRLAPPETATPINAIRLWIVTLIECPACLGWWTGAIIGGAIDGWWGIFIGAFYTAGSNYILAKVTRLID